VALAVGSFFSTSDWGDPPGAPGVVSEFLSGEAVSPPRALREGGSILAAARILGIGRNNPRPQDPRTRHRARVDAQRKIVVLP